MVKVWSMQGTRLLTLNSEPGVPDDVPRLVFGLALVQRAVVQLQVVDLQRVEVSLVRPDLVAEVGDLGYRHSVSEPSHVGLRRSDDVTRDVYLLAEFAENFKAYRNTEDRFF